MRRNKHYMPYFSPTLPRIGSLKFQPTCVYTDIIASYKNGQIGRAIAWNVNDSDPTLTTLSYLSL